jgi:hypothetical protein
LKGLQKILIFIEMMNEKSSLYADLDLGNFISEGKVHMIRCPECLQKNWGPHVATGDCAWCGTKGSEHYKETLELVQKIE